VAQPLAQQWRRLLAALALELCMVLAFVSVTGCRATERAAPGHEGSLSSGYVLGTDAQGRVDASTTKATGMRGHWYAYADTEDCLKRHPAGSCSLLIAPDPAAPNVTPTDELGVCMLGVTARVIAGPDGTPDWGGIWGARVGLSLNDDGAYDAPAHGVSGFAFRLDSEPAPNLVLQVRLTTSTASEAATWGGASSDRSPVHVGLNAFRWADVGGPAYIDKPPPFDPTELVAIEFGVHASPGTTNHFSFCVRELTALTN
jgi:hypothetical protein